MLSIFLFAVILDLLPGVQYSAEAPIDEQKPKQFNVGSLIFMQVQLAHRPRLTLH